MLLSLKVFFNIYLQYEPGNTARYLYKRNESDYLNKDIFECSYTFICKWISGFSKIICWLIILCEISFVKLWLLFLLLLSLLLLLLHSKVLYTSKTFQGNLITYSDKSINSYIWPHCFTCQCIYLHSLVIFLICLPILYEFSLPD